MNEMTSTTMPEGYDLDMDEVCRWLNGWGVFAEVQQTGGGCATIYAGETRPLADGDGEVGFSAVGGPGTFGWGARPSFASSGEFYVGPDGIEPESVDAGLVGARSARDVALLLAEQVKHPDRVSTPEEVSALGFDGEARRVEDVAEELRDQRVRVTADLGFPLGVQSTDGELVAVTRSSWGAAAPYPSMAILQREDGGHVAVALYRGTSIVPVGEGAANPVDEALRRLAEMGVGEPEGAARRPVDLDQSDVERDGEAAREDAIDRAQDRYLDALARRDRVSSELGAALDRGEPVNKLDEAQTDARLALADAAEELLGLLGVERPLCRVCGGPIVSDQGGVAECDSHGPRLGIVRSSELGDDWTARGHLDGRQ